MTEVLDPQMEAMQEAARPRPQHEWLKQFVGEWEYEGMGQCLGSAPQTMRGTQSYRMIGELWLVGESTGDCGTSIITIGYDPQKEKFVGSWFGDMMPNHWVYEGSLDADERVLTLPCDGPSFTKPGETGKYRDVVTVLGKDHHTLTGTFLDDNGQWQEMMTTHYRRKK